MPQNITSPDWKALGVLAEVVVAAVFLGMYAGSWWLGFGVFFTLCAIGDFIGRAVRLVTTADADRRPLAR